MASQMQIVLLAMPGAEQCANSLGRQLGGEPASVEVHVFPDGESCPRLPADLAGRDVVLVCHLNRPDAKIMQLYLAACTARELGARRVGLVLPYLPYMRQDAPFAPGQGVTSCHFAALLSTCCDWLVTVDPHLHRHHALSDIYRVPALALPAAPAIAAWIAGHVPHPLVVGPDGESAQWAREVARLAQCPVIVLEKIRHGDHQVEVSATHRQFAGCTPVLVDDIVSTARTMIAATAQLAASGAAAPVCIAVHALFAGDALQALTRAGAGRIVSCNSVVHASNRIDLAPVLAEGVRQMLAGTQ